MTGTGKGSPGSTGYLRCDDCGERFYSAGAEQMIARGERCDTCGGRLWHTARPAMEQPPQPLDLAAALLAAGVGDPARQDTIARIDEILRIDPARISLN